MKKLHFILLIILSGFPLIAQDYKKPDYNNLKNPYLSQKPSGILPVVFAPFIADKEDHKHSAPVFSADGKEMFFSVYIKYKHPQRIFMARVKDGKWTEPKEMFYSGEYQMGGPVISKDGKRIYLYCRKPLEGNEQRKNAIIWFSEKENGKWSDLKPLQYNYIDSLMYLPSYVTNENELYFTIGVNRKSSAIYKGKILKNQLINVIKLNDNINKEGLDNSFAVLSPDNSSLIFWRFNRKDFSTMGLCMSVKDKNGEWGEARFMGDMINNGNSRFPGFSLDGKYFFFTSSRTGEEEIYWVDTQLIDYLKTEDLNLVTRLYETGKSKSTEQILEHYNLLKNKYQNYYQFDGTLINNVAEKLLKEKDTIKAAGLMKQGFLLYPDNQSVTQRLLLSMIENDDTNFKNETNKIRIEAEKNNNDIEPQINRLGYKLLEYERYDDAIKIFSFNTELFPQSSNAHDSLGEAYMFTNNNKEAIISYNKSLELNPENENAKAMLEKLNDK